MKITQEQLVKVVRTAFHAGEVWGCSYTGWFEPTEKAQTKHISKVLHEITKKLKKEI